MVSWHEAWMELIRKNGKERNYVISKHANKRMGERDVSDDDVQMCLVEGKYIEHQDHGRDIKYLLQGKCDNGSIFYMVIAFSYPKSVIVTVCRFKEEAWDDLGPVKIRKK